MALADEGWSWQVSGGHGRSLMAMAGIWWPWQVASGHVGHKAEQTQLDADPEPGHWWGQGCLCLRRFLPEGLGDTRGS